MLQIFVFVVCLFAAVCDAVHAAPNVTGATVGSTSITVTGSGFGTKSHAAPILWENFEGGTHGANLPTTGRWIAMGSSDGGKFSNASPYSGSLAAYNQVAGTSAVGPNLGEFNTSYYSFSGTEELYYSYRWKYVVNDPPNLASMRCVIKPGRIGSTGTYYTGTGNMLMGGWPVDSGGASIAYHNGVEYIDMGWTNRRPTSGVWQRHELYKKLSTAGVSDGTARATIDSRYDQQNDTAAVTRATGQTFQHTSVLLGLMGAGYESYPLTDVSFFVDDVYIDNTQARVEICDTSTHSTATNCEIQIPTAWADGSVTADINSGAFAPGATVYVFVIDKDNVPSAGYQVTLAGGSGGGTPGPSLKRAGGGVWRLNNGSVLKTP